MNIVVATPARRTGSGNELWGTIEVWSQALGLPEWQLRERLAGCPSSPTWVREEEFEYVTDSYAEADVIRLCHDLLMTAVEA
jgi:hypothetical protein